MKLRVPIYPTELFKWDGYCAVVEDSSLPLSGLGRWSLVYDDACDIGFEVIGKTGAKVLFTMVSKDGIDEETTGRRFASVHTAAQRQQGMFDGMLKILIIND